MDLRSLPRLRDSSISAFKVVSSKIVLIAIPLNSWVNLPAFTVADPRRQCQTGEWGVGEWESGRARERARSGDGGLSLSPCLLVPALPLPHSPLPIPH